MSMTQGLDFDDVLTFARDFPGTSPADKPVHRTVVLAKSEKYVKMLEDNLLGNYVEVMTLTFPRLLDVFNADMTPRTRPLPVADVDKMFIMYHNRVNADKRPAANYYAADVKMHPSVVLGVEGMRYFMDGEQERPLAMKHMGNVVIEDDVEIGAYTVIHRATLGSTYIGPHCKIGSFVNVGHNVVVGQRTAITPFVCIGGSAKIGAGCWIGMHTTIRDNVKICPRVKVGMGSLVTKDINRPGLYFGNPATRRGDWDGRW